MKDHKDVRLAQALLCSILAHILLLSVARLPPPRYDDARSREGLAVSFRGLPAPSAVASMPSAPATLTPDAAPPPPRSLDAPPLLLRRSSATPLERPSARADTAAFPAGASDANEAADADEASQTVAGSEGQAGQGAGTAAEGAALGDGAAGDAAAGEADAMPAYFMAIGEIARKLRRYPARARELGHEGRVDVLLIWRPGMKVPQVELQQGSGSSLLDHQGVGMLRQAAALAPMPEALRRRAFSVVLPVEFSLEQPESTR
ncbi:MAG: energy transducer TonB [Zoogloeaceae bacterium]|jgi:TonB family protein|nr:energy transducer TonB [Zoogloeaceae bacterium]